MNKKYKKRYYIIMTKFYRTMTLVLLIILLSVGILHNASSERKCTKVKEVKNEIINPNTVFFGDSITDFYNLDKYFPNLKKVNSGITGNRTWDLKNDMYTRVYRYNPSKVILLVGINNFLYEDSSVDSVVSDIEEMTNEIHENLPNCEIYIQSVYPVNDDWRLYYRSEVPTIDILKEKILESNKKLKTLCKNNNYIYVDIFSSLADENNEFMREYSKAVSYTHLTLPTICSV